MCSSDLEDLQVEIMEVAWATLVVVIITALSEAMEALEDKLVMEWAEEQWEALVVEPLVE